MDSSWMDRLQSAEVVEKRLSDLERFNKAVERLAQVQPGQGIRNTELNKVAFIGGTLIRAGKCEQWWVENELREACEANDYIKDDGEDAFQKTMASGITSGKQTEPEHTNPIYKMALPSSRLGSIPPAKWLIKGVIQEKTIAFIISPPNVGKSFMALDLAAHIADQDHWHGRAIQANGKTVYITPEGAESLDRRRVAWEKYHNKTMSDDVVWIPDAIHVGSSMWNSFVEYCEDIKPKVIIIDTLARNTGGSDENDTGSMKAVVAFLDALRISIGCTIIVVHHVNKSAGAIRGSSSLEGAADTVINMASQGDGLPINVWLTKQKNGRKDHLGKYILHEVNVSEDETSVVFIPQPVVPWEMESTDD